MRRVLRFLALALPAALLVLAAVEAAAVALGWGPDAALLGEMARSEPLAPTLQAAVVLFETVSLVALFLLVEGRSTSPLLDGLAAGFAAWLFRGPVLVATVAALTRLPTAPFWQSARIALVALPAAGLTLGWLARPRRPKP
jgi:hypothetical protein